jgi:hypothetical protein
VTRLVCESLDAGSRRRLVKLCGMLGSIHPGERAAAGLKADQLVKVAGESWDSVITPLPALADDWREQVLHCSTHPGFNFLDAREQNFLTSMARWRGDPSAKQRAWLLNLHERLRGAP